MLHALAHRLHHRLGHFAHTAESIGHAVLLAFLMLHDPNLLHLSVGSLIITAVAVAVLAGD